MEAPVYLNFRASFANSKVIKHGYVPQFNQAPAELVWVHNLKICNPTTRTRSVPEANVITSSNSGNSILITRKRLQFYPTDGSTVESVL